MNIEEATPQHGEVMMKKHERDAAIAKLEAEKALKEAQEQPAVAWMIHEYQGTGEKRLQFQPHIPSIRDAVTGPIVTALYARPVPAAPAEDPTEMRRVISGVADRLGLPTENGNRLHDLSFWLDSQPAVPEMTDDALKEILNAAQIVGYDDPLRIVRGFAMRVLQEWGDQEGMHKAFLDAVKPAVAAPAVPSGWNIRRDGDVLIVQHPDIGGCSVQKEPDWERMIPEAILYSLADALLQSRAVKDSLTTQADCRACVNRGQVNGLSQESYCDSCIYQGRDWRKNHFVDASKTADAVKRRCDACAVLPCSCK